MITDLQKASMLKRISAAILDLILLAVAICGFALLLSAIFGFDGYYQQMNDFYTKYETQYGIDFEIPEDEYYALPETQRQQYDKAYDALVADQDAMYVYNMVVNLTLVIATVSILLGYLILEFAIPLIFKNGQTIGKKVFAIGLMHTDGVKLSTVQLFMRTVIGKYTLETMIPVYILIMLFFNTIGLLGTVILAAIALLQIILIASTKTNSAIHDKVALTVAVDLSSQKIFESYQEQLDYIKRIQKERAARQSY